MRATVRTSPLPHLRFRLTDGTTLRIREPQKEVHDPGYDYVNGSPHLLHAHVTGRLRGATTPPACSPPGVPETSTARASPTFTARATSVIAPSHVRSEVGTTIATTGRGAR